MEATIKFNLPEDQSDYTLANNAYKYYSTLRELAEEFRKAGNGDSASPVQKLTRKQCESIFQYIHNTISDHGLNLDDVS